MGKIILDFGEGWNAKFLESVYKNNDYDAGSMADDMIRMQLKEAIFADESNFTDECKQGKWIDFGLADKYGTHEYKCTSCNNSVYDKEENIKYHKYCLHCGSRNEVEND